MVKEKKYTNVRRSALKELIAKIGNIKIKRCLDPRGMGINLPNQSESIKNKYKPKSKSILRNTNKFMKNFSSLIPGIVIFMIPLCISSNFRPKRSIIS